MDIRCEPARRAAAHDERRCRVETVLHDELLVDGVEDVRAAVVDRLAADGYGLEDVARVRAAIAVA